MDDLCLIARHTLALVSNKPLLTTMRCYLQAMIHHHPAREAVGLRVRCIQDGYLCQSPDRHAYALWQ